jgi:Pyruvate/2-oxoacid:ferredoxin oxidoreductase delta subunit
MELSDLCPRCRGQTLIQERQVADHAVYEDVIRCAICTWVLPDPYLNAKEAERMSELVDYETR